MKQFFSLLLIFPLLVCIGCGRSELDRSANDMTSWEKELHTYCGLLGQIDSVRKTAIVQGKEESKWIVLDSADWVKELALFFSYDITQPNWQDDLAIDSSSSPQGHHIQYRRSNDRIPVIKAERTYNDKQFTYRCLIQRSNAISKMDRTLTMKLPGTILLDTKEKLLFLSDHHVKIIYEWSSK